jgi:hypothetical protein
MALGTLEEKVERLSTASLRKVMEPDLDLPGDLGPGQILPDDLLSISGLDLDLSAEQRAQLSREEMAAIFDGGIRFESVLMAGFCFEILLHDDLCDPRVTYALHEIGEETRHSRLFARVISQTGATSKNPLRGHGRLGRWLDRRSTFALLRRPAFLNTMILSGEEIPDLMQKLASEHPDTDPFLREVNLYHRREESRHLSFARLQVSERWQRATWSDRFAVRHIAPIVIREQFHYLVHPAVYGAVGLPAWRTWMAVRRLPARSELLRTATRPVLRSLIDAGCVPSDRIPRQWRRLCGIDRYGAPITQ